MFDVSVKESTGVLACFLWVGKVDVDAKVIFGGNQENCGVSWFGLCPVEWCVFLQRGWWCDRRREVSSGVWHSFLRSILVSRCVALSGVAFLEGVF